MAKYREIRSRIVGVESTAKITSAMKMVAAARLRRAQDAIIATRPYTRKLQDLLQFLATTEEGAALSPLFEQREVERVAVVVVTADRGLCGAFNTNVLRAAVHYIDANYSAHRASGRLDLVCIGRRAVDFFRKQQYTLAAAHPGIFSSLEFPLVRQIATEITASFLERRVDRIDIVYTEFHTAVKQEVVTAQFLPIPRIAKSVQSNVDYIFEPGRTELLAALLPRYVNTRMWTVLLDSNAAEQGARMTAMENATRNAKDLVRSLRLAYNKARQSAITTEIMEIVSGAEALRNT